MSASQQKRNRELVQECEKLRAELARTREQLRLYISPCESAKLQADLAAEVQELRAENERLQNVRDSYVILKRAYEHSEKLLDALRAELASSRAESRQLANCLLYGVAPYAVPDHRHSDTSLARQILARDEEPHSCGKQALAADPCKDCDADQQAACLRDKCVDAPIHPPLESGTAAGEGDEEIRNAALHEARAACLKIATEIQYEVAMCAAISCADAIEDLMSKTTNPNKEQK